MKDFKFIVYQDGKHFVSQCLNVEVSSFGDSVDEAVSNLNEAVELYFEDNENTHYTPITMAMIGDSQIHV
jgi:predicted RNase H-like HicB family nuclease